MTVSAMRFIPHTPNKAFPNLALSLKCFRLTYRRQTFLDDETQTVRIRYVPKDISQDEFIYVAEKLRGLFLYNPLVLSDGMRIRSFSIDFSLENYTLVTELVYNYTVKVRNESTYDKAEDLILGGDL